MDSHKSCTLQSFKHQTDIYKDSQNPLDTNINMLEHQGQTAETSSKDLVTEKYFCAALDEY